MYKLHICV